MNNDEILQFDFCGELTEKDAMEGIKEWKELFAFSREQKLNIIWNCENMTGYENKARIAWQKAIKELKKQIKCIWLITDSKIIRTGAVLMNTFTSFNLRVVKSSEKISTAKEYSYA